MRISVLPFLLTATVLSASAASAQTYPFEGTWDCSVAVFSFSGQIFNNGTENMDITDVSEENDGYVVTFADDYQLALTMNPDGTLGWYSPASGDSFTCAKVD